MRSVDSPRPPATATPAWSEADLVELAARLAREAHRANEPAPAGAGPLTGRVSEWGGGALRSSTAPGGRAWSVPLLVTEEAEAWLLGWPAGLVAPAHAHGAAVAVTVVEGTLSEECLDPTIWTTGRRTTWRAGATTLFPPGHVHLLGAAGDRPATAVHAWSAARRGTCQEALLRTPAAPAAQVPATGGPSSHAARQDRSLITTRAASR